ncbi:AI-2E family transporter [Gordonia rubripertincta]|uniref:AI-2E family transporter n=1 Tax=Gordonia rubripertincta TaxID=36822 RepID=A0ABT4MRV9_GORRU|nr:AI-2E family transporter [Gordonia rubripertincta]MCZ4548467.1 AI-2E family transporter [Gordonia rubripertincta]
MAKTSSGEPLKGAAGADDKDVVSSSPAALTPNRGFVIGQGTQWLAKHSLRLILIAGGAWVLAWIIGKTWVVLLPILLAIIVCTVLWPPVGWLRRKGMNAAAASAVVLLLAVGVVAGIMGAIAPSVVDQSGDLASQATDGVVKIQDWLHGPPFNFSDDQLDNAVNAITSRIQDSSTTIASGVFTGVTAATSVLITLFTVLFLTFFFLKDGPRFVPWLRRTSGTPAAEHLAEVLTRIWSTLGGFIRTQALVSAIDAVLIGLGLVILGVPLAYALAIITFFGGFIPIVGAFVAGALAVLVALVGNGPWTALIVLGIIVAVQQLEGNVLQPWLQSRSMNLHAAIVLLAVTGGGTLFGIIGAFLAVPVAAVVAVILRYLNEQIAIRAGEKVVADDEDDDLVVPDDGVARPEQA